MQHRPHIFVTEDDDSIRMLLEVALQSEGYEVDAFADAHSTLRAAKNCVPDAMLLDIMLDGMDGITALHRLRADPHTGSVPVMMLTAKDSETDKIIGLDAGADDYMTKPFSVAELCARVRALLRRSGLSSPNRKGGVLASGALRLNPACHEAALEGVPLELTNKEYELLLELMQHAPDVLGRDELLQTVWGYDFIGETRTLDMHIGTLRHKLGDESSSPRYIKTVRGVGYRFLGEVKQGG